MSMTLKPTPWRVSDSHGLCIAGPNGVIADLDSRLVADPAMARRDAERIIRAVNCHDELVAALDDALGWLCCHAQGLGSREELQATERYQKARAILAKAQG